MVGVVIGSYEIIRELGEGGMGAVYLGQHTLLGRRAAIKVLQPPLSARPDVVTRFFHEARAVTSISDPGIVQVYDFGYHVDGSAFLVMEYLEGEALDQRLARLRRLGVHEALRLCRQVAVSLAAAHAQQIIHRDLKPENIFLVRDAEVASGERSKILDFGIAKRSADHPGKLQTHAGTLMGTPAYMSPEQCRGLADIDHRSDIYSLGCVLFHLLTGRPPFEGESMGDVLSAHLGEPAPRPSSVVPGLVPAGAPGIAHAVDALVLRCLAKAPADRFATMADVAAAIGQLLPQIAPEPPVFGVDAAAAALALAAPPPAVAVMPTTIGAGAGQVMAGTPRRSRVGVWISAVLVGGAAAAGIWLVTSHGGKARPPAAAAAGGEVVAVAAPSAPLVAQPDPQPVPSMTTGANAAPAAVGEGSAGPGAAAVDEGSAGSRPTAAVTVEATTTAVEAERAAPAAAAPPASVPAAPADAAAPAHRSSSGARGHERSHRAATTARAAATAAPPGISAAPPAGDPAPPAGAAMPVAAPPAMAPPPATTSAAPPAGPARCSKAAFAQVYNAAAPSKDAVRAALRVLEACHDSGAVDDDEFDRAQSALAARL